MWGEGERVGCGANYIIPANTEDRTRDWILLMPLRGSNLRLLICGSFFLTLDVAAGLIILPARMRLLLTPTFVTTGLTILPFYTARMRLPATFVATAGLTVPEKS